MNPKTAKLPSIHSYLLIAVVLLVSLISFPKSGMVNNGDFLRVHQSMPITTIGWRPLEDSYSFDAAPKVAPDSLMAATGFATGWLAKSVKAGSMPMWLLVSTLLAIFWIGTVILVKQIGQAFFGNKSGLIIIFSLCLCLAIYSVYFKSLYEEALVLALCPLFTAGIISYRTKGKLTLYVVSATAILLCKAQMLYFLPLTVLILLYPTTTGTAPRWLPRIAAAAFLVAICMSYQVHLSSTGGMSAVNNFNRTYNGIGWALQSSASWPASTFEERLAYFEKNRSLLQHGTMKYEPDAAMPLLGESYWPTGARISSERWTSGTTPARAQQIKEAFDRGRPSRYLHDVATHAAIAKSLLGNTIKMAWRSDFSLKHLRPDINRRSISATLAVLAKPAFQLACITLLALFALRPNKASLFVTLYFCIGAPLFVVLGDGYYEFEKHLAPFIMLLPAIVAIQLFSDQRKGDASH